LSLPYKGQKLGQLSPLVQFASVIRKEDRRNNLYLYKIYVNFEESRQLFL